MARIDNVLREVHSDLNNLPILNRAKVEKDKAKAKEIQNILYNLKNHSLYAENIVENELNQQMLDIINEATKYLNSRRKGSAQLSSDALFKRAHGSVKTQYGGDDIFEEELAAVLAAIEFKATGQTLLFSNKIVGGKQANIKIDGVLDKPLEILMDNFITKVKQRVTTTNKKTQYHWTKPVARSGKVDINGISTLEINATINEDWQKLYDLFSNCTFSLKNYSSYRQDSSSQGLNIHLGNSDYFKALYSVLTDSKGFNYSHEKAQKIIYSGLKSYNTSKSISVAQHFYHLRFIYELTGIGLYDDQGNPISGVDFLIYNDPSSDKIYVKSTSELILKELDKKKTSHPFKSISIPKIEFDND